MAGFRAVGWAALRRPITWAIGLLVGTQLLFTSCSLVMLALAARAHRQAAAI